MARLDQEIRALRKLGAERNIHGGRIAYAFGYAAIDDERRDFLFQISRDGQGLHATIDFYTARGVPAVGFDVDAWEASKLHVTDIPATRADFIELSRFCRALLPRRPVNVVPRRVSCARGAA